MLLKINVAFDINYFHPSLDKY